MSGVIDRWIRLFSELSGKKLKREIGDEFAFHIDEQTKVNIRNGLEPKEAERRALDQFGDLESVRNTCFNIAGGRIRDKRRKDHLGALIQDAHYAFRTLIRKPGLTIAVLLTLAIGIGATTVIFSVVNSVLLRPYPYRDPDRIVKVAEKTAVYLRFGVAPANFLDWREQNHVFEDMAAFRPSTVTMTGAGEPVRILGQRVSASFFPILGVDPMLGRTFLPEEDLAEGEPVVVISYNLWRRRFSGNREILGQTLILSDINYTIVGIMPEGFRFFTYYWDPKDVELWIPNPFYRDPPGERAAKRLLVIARLKPGISLTQAQDEMDVIASRLEEEYPETNEGWGVRIDSFHSEMVQGVRSSLLFFLGAVAFVLLISCVNVANLLLARAIGRKKEIAIRTFLGAGRRRLVRLLLTESALIGILGGGLGLVLSLWGVPALVAITPTGTPRLDETVIDGNILLFTLGISVLTTLVFGLVPSMQGSKTNLGEALKEGSGGTIKGVRQFRGRNLLVITEIALALVLLIGAGLMLNSFSRLNSVDPGINSKNLLLADVNLPRSKYAEQAGFGTQQYTERFILWRIRPEQTAFVQNVVERINALPTVESAAAINYPPVEGQGWGLSFTIEGLPPPESPEDYLRAYAKAITQEYFHTMGVSLLRGRFFTDADKQGTPEVVVINSALVAQCLPDEDPIGKRLRMQDGVEDKERSFEIVGIVGDVKQAGLDVAEAEPILYIPYSQQAAAYVDWQVGFRMTMTFIARTRGEQQNLVPALRDIIWSVDKDQPISTIRTMEQTISETHAERQFYTLLLAIFAGIGVILATLGIYGLIAYSVSQRTHEIGIRLALGASKQNVLCMVLRQGFLITVVGVAVGLGAALGLTRFLASQLYGVTPTDPPTLAGITVLFILIALVATLIPAYKASKANPMVSLRYE